MSVTRRPSAKDFTRKPRDVVPGDVLEIGTELVLVVSNEYPATTVPRPEANDFCEPRVVFLKHQVHDKWVQTHECTFLLLPVDTPEPVFTSLRVQYPARTGRFLAHDDLVARLEQEGAVRT